MSEAGCWVFSAAMESTIFVPSSLWLLQPRSGSHTGPSSSPGDGGLTIPFTKPTLNHSLCLQVVAHSNAGGLIISLHMGKSFRSLGPRAIMYF